MSSKSRSLLTSSILTCGFFASSYAFSVECYDTINTPTLLVEELNCPLSAANPYALTIVGPFGSLRMLGAGKVTCTPLSGEGESGILIKGVSASMINGKIESCPNGVSVAGKGTHTIINSEITDFIDNGIIISSSYNFITGNEIVGLGVSAGGAGVLVNPLADFNNINNNYVSATGSDGILVDGKFTTITVNHIVGTDDDGISLGVDSGRATVTGNFVSLNRNEGIQMTSDQNFISGNVVFDNGLVGILIAGSSTNNVIENNKVNENFDDGIAIFGGSIGNTVKNNTAIGNGEDDLQDNNENAFCTNQLNTWSNNDVGVDGTSNPACLKDL
ncbi:right-handed parallel beta-helix repeat-containing protein [Microbulbifer sp. SSSA007]|uniref:right-handed parallel beta-helix repeat-containing protein n=1 Tax=Microbulbifer sp. SSSA007 TaxID=3243379 RepID=UPI00403A4139